MALEACAEGGRERAQLARLRELGDEALGGNVEAALGGARAEVEVEAALEALLDEGRVGGDAPQCAVARGEEVRLALARVGGELPAARLDRRRTLEGEGR